MKDKIEILKNKTWTGTGRRESVAMENERLSFFKI